MGLFAAAETLRHPVSVPIPSISSSPPHAAANTTPANASPLMEDVVAILEHASMSAKLLSYSAPFAGVDASEVASAIASLRDAHRVIGSFLHQIEPRLPPPAGVVGSGEADSDEPMEDYGSAAVEEADASSDVGEVDEGIAECGMQSKRRRKRPVPPCWPAGRRDYGDVAAAVLVDHRRSVMDLVFQFHG